MNLENDKDNQFGSPVDHSGQHQVVGNVDHDVQSDGVDLTQQSNKHRIAPNGAKQSFKGPEVLEMRTTVVVPKNHITPATKVDTKTADIGTPSEHSE